MREKELIELLKLRKQELEAVRMTAGRLMERSPEGHLRVSPHPGRVQYYQMNGPGDRKGKLIHKKEVETLAVSLAQKDYCIKIKKRAEEELKLINQFLKRYPNKTLAEIYGGMNKHRKKLIPALIESDEEYVANWLKEPYQRKEFPENAPEYYTNKGERVRSKSEVIIADMLGDFGIPYKYECPLIVDGTKYVYIDFTILLVKKRKQIYLEHFGMMDNSEYQNDFFYKINNYSRNGIVLGDNLIATFESRENPLNVRTLKKVIEAIYNECF